MTTNTASQPTLRCRSLLKELDLTPAEFKYLLDLAAQLKALKSSGIEQPFLQGRNIAMVFEKASTRTRSAFEVAAAQQGAHSTYLGPVGSHIGTDESFSDTAQVLGRMFDGIAYRGTAQSSLESFAVSAGVPVWNALTDDWHPTQMLGDMLTMGEHSRKQINEICYCFLGDTRNNVARSLLVTGALLGMDVRLAGPRSLWPPTDLIDLARRTAADSGATVLVTDDIDAAVRGVDFVYTDVWLSMGEAQEQWRERIRLLRPFQVNRSLIERTGNPGVKFMHCLPAHHDRATAVGERLFEETGMDALEVTDEVFSSERSVVFDQAENRMHTIKAVMVATLREV